MKFYQSPQFWVRAVAVLIGLVILQQIWQWEVERVDVPSRKFLVLVHRWGKNLDEGQIVAPDKSYKGVMLDVLPEGRHFLNPIFWSHEVHDIVNVPPGQCLVVTRKFGKQLPEGAILAQGSPNKPYSEEDQRGILHDVLKPGDHRLNPYAYSWKAVPAIDVRVYEIGVRTLKVGKDPRTLSAESRRGHYLVPDGYRGVQQTTVPPGTYYINPYVESISPVEVRSHRVKFADIEFPSRDGFILKPQVVVEYAARPERAPELAIRLTDEGELHQKDDTPEDQQRNEILQKVVLPHIRGYARIEGSNFDARDFILNSAVAPEKGEKMLNAREALQKALLAKVKPRCEELGVEIRAVTLADMRPPAELADQISLRELARVEQAKNAVLLRQHKAAQELRAKEALKKQYKEKVEAETRRVQAATKATQMQEVETSRLEQDLANAQFKLDAAKKRAEAMLLQGNADAKVINLENEAEVAGLRKAVQGFTSAQHYAQYQIIAKLAPALSEVFASDDSDFAKLFTSYLTPSTGPAKPPTPVPASPTANAAPAAASK